MTTQGRPTVTGRRDDVRELLTALHAAREETTAYAYGTQLLMLCSRYPLTAPYDLTIEDLEHALTASRHATTAREMHPPVREKIHALTLRLSRLLTEKRTARDQTLQQLAGGEFPQGAPGTRPVRPTGPAPDLPPTGIHADEPARDDAARAALQTFSAAVQHVPGITHRPEQFAPVQTPSAPQTPAPRPAAPAGWDF
jgi:hypothetical protein